MFNEILLTLYREPVYDHQKPLDPPGPVNMEGHPEYEVEEILQSRKRGQGIQYLVKWKDYGNEENTWEPRRNVTNAEELIDNFYQRFPQVA